MKSNRILIKARCQVFYFFTFLLLFGSFGIHANEPMQSWFVCCVSLSSSLVSLSLSSSSSLVSSVQPSQWEHWSQKHYILQIYAHISLVYPHEILGQCDVYFWNGSYFSKFLNVVLLSRWLSLEPYIWLSYVPILGLPTGKKLVICG